MAGIGTPHHRKTSTPTQPTTRRPDSQHPQHRYTLDCDEPLVGAVVAASQARWIVVVAALACLFAVVMGSATLLTEVARMRRRHRLFAVYAGAFPRHLALGAGLVGLPLMLGGIVGGATGFLASYSAIRLGNASAGSAGSLLVALLTLVLVVAGVSSFAAAFATARSASGRFAAG